MKLLNSIGRNTAKRFSLIAGTAAFILAALTVPQYFAGAGAIVLGDGIVSALCGFGTLKGNRLAALILLGCAVASRYTDASGHYSLLLTATDTLIITAFALGVIGNFARDRLKRIEAGEPDSGWIDGRIAETLAHLSGTAGLFFGALIGWVSVSAAGEFSVFNLIDACLIMFLGWHTIKKRLWAAATQAGLCAISMTLAYSNSGDPRAVFGFIQLILFQTYLLGIAGTAKFRTGGDRTSPTSSRQSPI